MEQGETVIGRVRQVLGSRVTVELDPDLAGTSPLLEGRLHRVGQLGSILRIPQGTMDLLGSVTMIGISELAGPVEPGALPSYGNRWLQAQLLGERDGLGRFTRGISNYPSLDDAVHLTTDRDLDGVYPQAGDGFIRIGSLSAADQDLAIDLGRLVVRHGAIVGSTGAGKSSTVARLIQNIIAAGYLRANVIIIDPHGEYSNAFGDYARVTSVLDKSEDGALWVPYWALGPDDLLQVYAATGGSDGPTLKTRFVQEVLEARQSFLRDHQWASPALEDISTDTPVPFDIRQVWFNLDYADRATYVTGRGQGAICQDAPGCVEQLIGARFAPYAQGGGSPFQGPPGVFGAFRQVAERMKARLKDPLYRFLEQRKTEMISGDPLPDIISQWLGRERPVSILDFSGVPSDATDIAVGAVLSLLLQAALSAAPEFGIGRHRPMLIVLEEAHRFIRKDSPSALARVAVERIAREGRKYGVGLLLVTQRPSEVSDTVLSQCGTIISHRLTNSADQSRVESCLPDTLAQLAQVLPSLRTGEVLVTGEGVALPSRAMVDRPSPEPQAADPGFDAWYGEPSENDMVGTVARMRGQEERDDHRMDPG